MEIKKEQDGKWIFPAYGKFLVNASAKEDIEKLIVTKVFIPLDESNDQWNEITEQEKERIMSAKLIARELINIMNQNLILQRSLFTELINKFDLSVDKALEFKDMFPLWGDLIGNNVTIGFRLKYKSDGDDYYVLYEVTLDHIIQENKNPINTPELYEKIVMEN